MDGLTFAEAYAQGMSKDRLWRRVTGGLIVPVTRGAYLPPDKVGSLSARASVISRLTPSHVVVARRTAAWLWGLDVLPPGVDSAEWPVEVVVPRGALRRGVPGSGPGSPRCPPRT